MSGYGRIWGPLAWRCKQRYGDLALLVVFIFCCLTNAQSASVTLAWDANTEPDLAGYILHYGVASGVYSTHIDAGLGTTNTVAGLVEGVTYFFAVTARNAGGLESDPSNEISYTAPLAGAAPTIQPIANRTMAEDMALAVPFNISDADTPAAFLSLSARSSSTVLIASSNIFFEGFAANRTAIIIPNASEFGTAMVTFAVSDGLRTAERAFQVIVTPVNDPPTLSPVADVALAVSPGTRTIALSGIGPGAANETQTLSIRATSSNTGLIPNPTVAYTNGSSTGVLTFRPVNNVSGTSLITVTVNDEGTSNNVFSRAFWIYVRRSANAAPSISTIANRSVNEDASTGPIAFTIGDSVTPAALLTPAATSSDPALIPATNIVFGGSGSNRTVTIAPAPDRFGTATITVSATDTNQGYASTTFVLTVNAVNDRPDISSIAAQAIDTNTYTRLVPFTVSDVETPAAALLVSAVSSNQALVHNTNLVVTGQGTNRALFITAQPEGTGITSISIIASDGAASRTNSFVLTVPSHPTTEGSPRLSIRQSAKSVVVSWPAALTGFQLERLDSLDWQLEMESSELSGSERALTVAPTNGVSLYRLRKAD